MTPTFLRIGHRGAAAYATENTLSSIQTAIACGVDMVELDVRMTKDKQLVLAHDGYLHGEKRQVKIKTHTLEQLQQVCLPGGEVVTRLDEALKFIRGRALVNIDLKEKGTEEPIVRLVEKLGMEKQVMFSGFHAHSLKTVKKLNKKLYVTLSYPSSYLIKLYDIRWLRPVIKLLERRVLLRPTNSVLRHLIPLKVKRLTIDRGIDALIIRSPFISPKLVDIVHNRELKLYAFPADAAHEVEKLKQWGVDGVESNRPDVLRASMADSGPLAHSR